jgi:hypothetical protein
MDDSALLAVAGLREGAPAGPLAISDENVIFTCLNKSNGPPAGTPLTNH